MAQAVGRGVQEVKKGDLLDCTRSLNICVSFSTSFWRQYSWVMLSCAAWRFIGDVVLQVWNEINSSTELASAPRSDWLKRYHQRLPFGLNAHLGRKVRWCRSSPKRTLDNEWVQNLLRWSIMPKLRSLVPFSFLIVTKIAVWGSSVSKYVVQLNSRCVEALRDCCWIQQSSENSADSNSLVDSAEALGSCAPEDPDSVRFISLKPTNIKLSRTRFYLQDWARSTKIIASAEVL